MAKKQLKTEDLAPERIEYVDDFHARISGTYWILMTLRHYCGDNRVLRDCIADLIDLNERSIVATGAVNIDHVRSAYVYLYDDLTGLKSACFRFMDLVGLDSTLSSAVEYARQLLSQVRDNDIE